MINSLLQLAILVVTDNVGGSQRRLPLALPQSASGSRASDGP